MAQKRVWLFREGNADMRNNNKTMIVLKDDFMIWSITEFFMLKGI